MNTIAQIFPRTGKISGPEVADGAKPDVPTTDVENEKEKQNTVYFMKHSIGVSKLHVLNGFWLICLSFIKTHVTLRSFLVGLKL